MPIPLLDLALVVTRLGGLDPGICTHAGRSIDLDDVIDGRGEPITPSVWVYPMQSDIDGPLGRGVGRTVTETLAVTCILQTHCAASADSADERLLALRQGVSGLLEGWRPAAAWSRMLYTGGALDSRTEQLYVWTEIYATQIPHSLTCE